MTTARSLRASPPAGGSARRTRAARLLGALLVLVCVVSGLSGVSPAAASPTDAAFNSSTGALTVDYAKYQSKHDIVYNRPTTEPKHGLTVGNGRPNSEVMGIHVEDTRSGVSAINLDLSLWDVAGLGNSGDVPNIETWRTVSTYADPTGAGLSRGQADPRNFGYTLGATVEGAAYTARVVDGRKVRLSITPDSSYTIWFTASTRLNAPSHNSVAEAKRALAEVKAAGYTSTNNSCLNWWHAFWQKSFYNSFLASNHTDLMAGFNKLYSRNFDALKAYTRTRYNVDGIWVPETTGWDGNARGTVNSEFTNNIWSTGTEAAYNMYLQYTYTNDTNYLRDTAYPTRKSRPN